MIEVKEKITKKVKQEPAKFKNNQPKPKPISNEKALQILIGAGVKIHKENKIQTWTIGKRYSRKVVNAAQQIDSMVEANGNPSYKTQWVEVNHI